MPETIWSKINPETTVFYRKKLGGEFSQATKQRRLSALRRFFAWAQGKGYLDHDPLNPEKPLVRPLETPKKAKKEPLAPQEKKNWAWQVIKVGLAVIIVILLLLLGTRLVSFDWRQFFVSPTTKTGEKKVTTEVVATYSPWIVVFRGQLTGPDGQPVTGQANVVFRLYDQAGDAQPIWESKNWPLQASEAGEFQAPLGDTTRGDNELPSRIFFQKERLYLGMSVNGQAESLPRTPVSTAAHAADALKLDGFSPSQTPGANMVPVLSPEGYLILAAESPKIKSTSGTFAIEGQAITLATPMGSEGNITLAPDSGGQLNINLSGQHGDQMSVTDANITSGNLVSVYAGNDATGFDLLNLSSGSTEEEKFSISASGDMFLARDAVIGGSLQVDDDTFFVDNTTHRVGIGTLSPDYALDVQGEARISQTIYNLYDKALKQGHEATIDTDGWYRIARTDNRASGLFNLLDMTANRYQSVSFYASVASPDNDNKNQMALNLLSNVRHNQNTFRDVRLVHHSATEPVYLEVYLENTDNNQLRYILSQNDWDNGWTPVDWQTGEIPDDYDSVVYSLRDDFSVNQNSLVINKAGSVGIGLAEPAYKLDVAGDIHIDSGSDLYIGAIGLDDTGSGNTTAGAYLVGTYDEFANSSSTNAQDVLDDLDQAISDIGGGASGLWLDGDPNDYIYPSSTYSSNIYLDAGALGVQYDPSTISGGVAAFNGNVGIGTTGPSNNLSIAGGVGIGTTSPTSDYHATAAAPDGGLIVEGNVGIGTTAPGAKLHIDDNGTATALKVNTGTEGANFIVFSTDYGGSETDIIQISHSSSHPQIYAAAGGSDLRLHAARNVWVRTDLVIPDGSASSPALAFYSDQDTGLYRLGADSLGLITGGTATQGLTIDAAGNVGIGTTDPGAELEVKGSSTGNVLLGGFPTATIYGMISLNNSTAAGDYNFISSANDPNLYINRPSGRDIYFRENNAAAAQLVILTGGFVGIGTTAPGYELDVAGDIGLNQYLYHNDDGNTYIQFTTDVIQFTAGGMGFVQIDENDTQDRFLGNPLLADVDFRWEGDTNVSLFLIDASAEKVGIGTTAPSETLDVVGTAEFSSTISAANIGTDTDNTVLILNSSGLLKTDEIDPDVWTPGTLPDGSGTANYIAKWADSDTLAESVMYDDGANIGIGITTPSNILSVAGGVGIGTTSPTSTYHTTGVAPDGGLIVEGNVGIGTTSPSALLYLGIGSTAAVGQKIELASGATANAFEINTSGATGGDLFVIEAGGSTGIGTTNPSNILSVAGGLGIGTTSPSSVYHTTGVAPDGGLIVEGNVGIGTTAPAEQLHVTENIQLENGSDIFSKNAAGTVVSIMTLHTDDHLYLTADEDIIFRTEGSSYTEQMRLTKAGRLGIGTTAPTAKLNVNGTAAIDAAGDVEIAYNLEFTHDTASYIRSLSPLYIEAGDPNSAEDLVLRSRGTGDVVVGNGATYFKNSGNVGIGTVNPGAELEVNGTALIQTNLGVEGQVYDITEDYLRINDDLQVEGGDILDKDSTTSLISLDSDGSNSVGFTGGNVGIGTLTPGSGKLSVIGGNVGIGTTTPDVQLSVTGGGSGYQALFGQDVTTGESLIFIGEEVAANKSLAIGYDHDNNYARLRINGDSSPAGLTIADGGNVGIGMTGSTDGVLGIEGMFAMGGSNSVPGSVSVPTDFLMGSGGSSTYVWMQTWTGAVLALNPSGNSVGIGTTSPSRKLHVYTTADDNVVEFETNQVSTILELTNSSGTVELFAASGGDFRLDTPSTSNAIRVLDGGNTGIGDGTPSQKLDVNGRIRMATWTADGDAAAYRDEATNSIALVTSDIRLKKNLVPLADALEKIDGIQGYFYHDLDDQDTDKKRLGVTAQDVMAVLPEATFSFTREGSNEKYYSVHYDKLGALLIEGVKELNQQVKVFTDKVTTSLITATDVATETITAIQAGFEQVVANRIESTEKIVSPLVQTTHIETESISLSEIDTKSGENIVFDLSEPAADSSFGEIVVKGANEETVASINATGDATFSGTLHAQKIVADEIVGLEARLDSITARQASLDEASARQGKFGELISATVSAQHIQGLEERLAQLEADATNPTPTPTTTLPEPTPTLDPDFDPLADLEISPDIQALVDEILATTAETTPQADLTEIEGETMELTSNLAVYGFTSLANTAIAGSLNVDATMTLADSSINTIAGPLYLQSLGLGGIDILAGKITINEQGNMTIEGDLTVKDSLFANILQPLPEKDLVIDLVNQNEDQDDPIDLENPSNFGQLIVKGVNAATVASIDASGSARFASLDIDADYTATESGVIIAAYDNYLETGTYAPAIDTNASVGVGLLPAYETRVVIKSPFVTDQSLIYVTPTTDPANKVLYLKAKKAAVVCEPEAIDCEPETGWFTIGLNQAISQEIEFNWWIVN